MKKFIASIAIIFFIISTLPSTSEAAKFKDVSNAHSLQTEIEYLVEQKVISGYPDNTFKPNEKILKKHVVAMVVKAMKLPTINVGNPGFKDVPTTHPYYKEIAAAYTAGIIDKSTTFKPNSTISRAFMADILTRAYDLDVLHTNNSIVDVKKSSSFHNAIHAVVSNSIANGSYDEAGDLYFQPTKLLTRGHFAAFLARAMTLRYDEYAANPNYNYYYDYSWGNETVAVYEYYELMDDYYWHEYSLTTDELQSITGYAINNNQTWVHGVPESDAAIFTSYPFTIGKKIAFTYDPESQDMQQTILTTNASLVIDGETVNNVTIFEDMYYHFDEYSNKIQYTYGRHFLAPDYGVVRSEYGDLGQKPDSIKYLTHRELVQ